MKTYLHCPFSDKDKVKSLGAKWDPEAKRWYVPAGVSATPFARWLTEQPQQSVKKASVPAAPQKEQQKSVVMDEKLQNIVDTLHTQCQCKVAPWDSCVHTGEYEAYMSQRMQALPKID